MRSNTLQQMKLALQSLPLHRNKGNDENGIRRQHGVEDEAEVRHFTEGNSGAVSEMKLRVGGSGRSFTWDVMPCLRGDSCRGKL